MFREEINENLKRALIIAAGGGGDSVGAVHTYMLLKRENIDPILGALVWERLSIDPCPGPVPMECFRNIKEISSTLYEVGPDTIVERCGRTFKPQISIVLESLNDRGIIYDPYRPVEEISKDIVEFCNREGIDLLIISDSGGDILASGYEDTLFSPLADAYTLSIAYQVERRGVHTIVGVFGPGCDGELSRAEIFEKFSILAGEGYFLFYVSLTPKIACLMEKIAEKAHTEASRLPIRAYRGERGTITIRRGERRVELDISSAATYYIDVRGIDKVTKLPLILRESRSILHAREILNRNGIMTELDIEEELSKLGDEAGRLRGLEFLEFINRLRSRIRERYSSSTSSSLLR